MKIHITEPEIYKYCDWSILRKYDFVSGDCDILCVGLQHAIDSEFLLKFPSVKYILSPTTGIDHISVDIPVIHLKSEDAYNIPASSEFALLLILASLRKFRAAIEFVDRQFLIGEDLSEQTVGILGYGRIGHKLHEYLKPFGCQVLCHDKTTSITKDDVLTNSDIIVVLVNGTPNNRNYISAIDFSKMKKKPYFVNISRSLVVDDLDLLVALRNNLIKGAAVDMVNNESVFTEYKKCNLIITPHIAGSSSNSQLKACNYVIQELAKELFNANRNSDQCESFFQ